MVVSGSSSTTTMASGSLYDASRRRRRRAGRRASADGPVRRDDDGHADLAHHVVGARDDRHLRHRRVLERAPPRPRAGTRCSHRGCTCRRLRPASTQAARRSSISPRSPVRSQPSAGERGRGALRVAPVAGHHRAGERSWQLAVARGRSRISTPGPRAGRPCAAPRRRRRRTRCPCRRRPTRSTSSGSSRPRRSAARASATSAGGDGPPPTTIVADRRQVVARRSRARGAAARSGRRRRRASACGRSAMVAARRRPASAVEQVDGRIRARRYQGSLVVNPMWANWVPPSIGPPPSPQRSADAGRCG